ncbi:MAG: hypothetical protein RIE31_07575 [Alphaproteobacteria bacterium]
MTTLSLNVDEAITMATRAGDTRVTRAAMLMAYGWNCSIEASEADFHLDGFIQLINAPRDPTPTQMDAFRDDYRAWIIGNGFRELVAALEPLLDFVHMVIAYADARMKNKRSRDANQACDKFERHGLALKFDQLRRRHGIDTRLSDHFETLTQARNCLTHRGGIVTDKDCNTGDGLRITWLGFDSSITEGGGREHVLTLDSKGPIDSSKFEGEDNPKLNIEWVNREALFRPGRRIYLPPRTLQEICHMGSLVCAELNRHAINWFLDHGVNVNGGVPVPPPKVEIYLDAIDPDDGNDK